MEEDCIVPPTQLEHPASAQSGSTPTSVCGDEGLDKNMADGGSAVASTAESTAASASTAFSRLSRRICSRPACNRVLGSLLLDPHTVCIRCRGFVPQVSVVLSALVGQVTRSFRLLMTKVAYVVKGTPKPGGGRFKAGIPEIRTLPVLPPYLRPRPKRSSQLTTRLLNRAPKHQWLLTCLSS